MAADAQLTAGTDTTICVPRDIVDELLDQTGRKDAATTVTAYYELRGSEADEFYAQKTRGSASYLKAATVAILAAYSTMC